jgi:hypothetical protein
VQIARRNPNFEGAAKAPDFTGFGLLPGQRKYFQAEKEVTEIGKAVSQKGIG